ncbi:hypothetical protein Tco_0675014 [Tanacetum coccineum]
MKGRLWSWMELVLALQMKDNQFGEPYTLGITKEWKFFFPRVEPLLIQLTLVTPGDSVIANSIPELLNIDSWYCRRGGKRSEEVGLLQNVHRNLVDWVAL